MAAKHRAGLRPSSRRYVRRAEGTIDPWHAASFRSPRSIRTRPTTLGVRCVRAAVGERNARRRPPRHPRAPAARPAHLGHRPLQFPLQLLHAEGGLRPELCVPAALVAADLRGDRSRRPAVRRPRREEDPPHRRRAAAAPRPRAAGGDARRAVVRRRHAARPHADDQRLDPRTQGRGAEGRGLAPRDGQPRRASTTRSSGA